MNILVFSPYRHINNLGIYSAFLLKSCFAEHQNVTYRHINVNNVPTDYNKKLESEALEKYDVIIQHCPYDYINHIPGIKNIWIPIIDNLCHIQDPYIEDLVKNMDLICIENPFTEMVIAKSIKDSTKIRLFDFKLDSNDIQECNNIDFGILNSSHKYYGILDYNLDELVLFNLIKNFIAVYRNNTDFALIILLACSPEQYTKVTEAIEQLSRNLSIAGNLSNIKIYATANISLPDTLPLHKSCDTYLNIENNTESIHKRFAELYGSSVSEKIDSDYSEAYGYMNNSCFGYKNKVYSLVSDSFDNIYKVSNKSPDHQKTLMEILSEK
tara:strand:- start:345 stop:1322 length:978 start_codon:yes stop_codon:yes gene_type:complete